MAALRKPSVAADLRAQLRPLPMIICGSVDGFVVAYQGGEYHENIVASKSLMGAESLRKVARWETAKLLARVFGGPA